MMKLAWQKKGPGNTAEQIRVYSTMAPQGQVSEHLIWWWTTPERTPGPLNRPAGQATFFLCRNAQAFRRILNAISQRWVHLALYLLWAADPALYTAWMILSLTRGFSLLNSLKEPFNSPREICRYLRMVAGSPPSDSWEEQESATGCLLPPFH